VGCDRAGVGEVGVVHSKYVVHISGVTDYVVCPGGVRCEIFVGVVGRSRLQFLMLVSPWPHHYMVCR
jgi:hypothetical protein